MIRFKPFSSATILMTSTFVFLLYKKWSKLGKGGFRITEMYGTLLEKETSTHNMLGILNLGV